MKWVSVVGARPQFVKVAAICRAIEAHNRAGGEPVAHSILNTGQHYDPRMAGTFFSELSIPAPAVDLAVGSGPHGTQTARMLEGAESFLLESRPDMVLVYGDTNSALAGALAAAKLHIPLAHVEAGLRSFNRAMPEEINRVAIDHISDVLLVPTQNGMRNLEREGLAARAKLTGDVMLDEVMHGYARAQEISQVLQQLGLVPGQYGVTTVHRAESTEVGVLAGLLDALNRVAADHVPLVFPVHPRTRQVIEGPLRSWRPHPRLRLVEPLGYLDMLRLTGSSRIVVTDSGGVQKEAFFLGRPCITLRTETEWTETVEAGQNIIAGNDPERVIAAVASMLTRHESTAVPLASGGPYGDGNASVRVVSTLLSFLGAH
jgi:UDP-GlcNAc3NAcA epimerase